MTEEEIGELLTAISEDFTTEQLNDEEYIRGKLHFLLSFNDAELDVFIPAVREIKALQGDRRPLWAQGLMTN